MENYTVKFSIQYKFFIFIAAIILFICSTLVVFFVLNTRRELYKEIEKRGITEARHISFDAKYGVMSNDSSVLNNIVAGRMEKPDIVYVEIIDEIGNILAADRGKEYLQLTSINNKITYLGEGVEKMVLKNKTNDHFYEYISNISRVNKDKSSVVKNLEEDALIMNEYMDDGETNESGLANNMSNPISSILGTIKVGISLENINKKMSDTLTISIYIIISVITISMFISYYFVNKLVKPIQDMTKASIVISKGFLTNTIEINSTDEIGQLSSSFNTMVKDLKRSRSILISTKEFADNIIKSMLNALVVINTDGTINTVNRGILNLLEYKNEELIGNDINMIMDEESRDNERWLNNLIKRGSIRDVEKTYLTKRGKKIMVLFSASIMHDTDGHVVGVVCAAQDITGRKESENALKASEERYRTLVQAIPDIVYKVDKNGFFTYINPYIRNLGYEPGELIGKHFSVIIDETNAESTTNSLMLQNHGEMQDSEDDSHQNEDSIKKSETWMVKNLEIHLASKKNSAKNQEEVEFVGLVTAFSEVSATKAYEEDQDNRDSKLIGTIGIIRDVTEKIKLQAETIRAGQLATLGELAASVAHEINSPLNSIIVCAELMSSLPADEKVDYETIKRIMIDSERITKVVSGLLSFTRDNENDMDYFSIHKLLSEILILTTAQTIKEKIHITLEFPPDLPMVYVHPQRIQHVFMNLINNARYALNKKYTNSHKNKTIQISGREVIINDHKHIQIIFKDKGTGIPTNKLNKVKNPFFTTKPTGDGTGLGLSISNKIINDQGGKITIDSVEGKYTNVSVYIPVLKKNNGQNSLPELS